MKILLKGGTEHEVDDVELRMLKQAYPKVDVDEQLRRMAEWCRANPQRLYMLRRINLLRLRSIKKATRRQD